MIKLTKNQIIVMLVILSVLVIAGVRIFFLGVAVDFDKLIDPRVVEGQSLVAKFALYAIIGTLLYLLYAKKYKR